LVGKKARAKVKARPGKANILQRLALSQGKGSA
jgi:hypothetical protein